MTAAEALKHPYLQPFAQKEETKDAIVAQDQLLVQKNNSKEKLKNLEVELLPTQQTPTIRQNYKLHTKTIYGLGLKSMTQGNT